MWPDGTKIYIEHVSHHPPISAFIVEHPDGIFRYEGRFEYKVKVCDLGNAIRGRQVGENRVIFKDGSVIKFQYPTMKLTGLLYGQRTLD